MNKRRALGNLDRSVGGRATGVARSIRRAPGLQPIAAVLLKYDVRVHAAETEPADAGAAGGVRGAMNPWSGLGVHVKPTAGLRNGFERIAAVQRRRQDTVIQRQDGFDHARRPSRRHRMTDHRLNGAQSAARWAFPVESKHAVQCFDFGRIADRRTRSVAFDQADRSRIDTAGFISAPKGQFLALHARGCHAGRPPVTAAAHPLNHRVDAIVIRDGVAQTLENQNPHALTRNDPVAVAVERANRSASRQRAHGREHLEEGNVGKNMHPANQNKIAYARQEITNPQFGGNQG